MDLRNQIIAPELVWTGSAFAHDQLISIDERGVIDAIGTAKPQATSGAVRLDRRAIIPGFVNAHSHAFQVGLRATPQRFDTSAGNFWSWRETMYRLADLLDADRCYLLSLQAFKEMLAAGITTVGEFHYLHHPGAHDEVEASHRWACDDAVLRAATDAGIRLVLIQTYYATGNVNQPLAGAQRRFGPVDRHAFVKQLDRLANQLDAGLQSLALACHSIRAAAINDLRYFRDMAHANRLPFNIHVEEVRKEIDDCRAAYGRTPIRVLLDELRIDENVNAIHCTHSTQEDLSEWIARGASICLCPITEGNLSDGFADLPFIRSRGGSVCFGSDCNLRISAIEELRMMEFSHRLRNERRGIIVDREGRCAPALLQIGTVAGARSLGVNAGTIEPGRAADLVSINLDHPLLREVEDSALADAILFGAGNEVVDGVWVGGRAVQQKPNDETRNPNQ